MTDQYIDQAVRKLAADGVSLRPTQADVSDPAATLDDGTELVRVDSLLGGGLGEFRTQFRCLVVGHRFDGRRNVTWDREETPAIQCSRCDLVRARRPTGGSVE